VTLRSSAMGFLTKSYTHPLISAFNFLRRIGIAIGHAKVKKRMHRFTHRKWNKNVVRRSSNRKISKTIILDHCSKQLWPLPLQKFQQLTENFSTYYVCTVVMYYITTVAKSVTITNNASQLCCRLVCKQ